MKLLYLSLLPLLLALNCAHTEDPIDKVAGIIGKGNAHEIAALLAPTVELTLMDEVNTYSKVQTELILQKFFAQNKPISAKMLHKVNSGSNYHFGVVIINTANGAYRAAFTLKGANTDFELIELRIESEKVK